MGQYAAQVVPYKPRDFTQANFRLRSTPSGELPLDSDLERTIRQGIPLSWMPSFKGVLSSAEMSGIINIIKGFSVRWGEEGAGDTLLPENFEILDNPTFRLKGQVLYKLLKCNDCHGQKGRADGPKAKQLKDEKDRPILPRNYTWGKFKSGLTDADVARAVYTGLDGTPMASFASSLPGKRVWYLVKYIRSFEDKTWFAKIFLQPLP
jgi:hypothetical protein